MVQSWRPWETESQPLPLANVDANRSNPTPPPQTTTTTTTTNTASTILPGIASLVSPLSLRDENIQAGAASKGRPTSLPALIPLGTTTARPPHPPASVYPPVASSHSPATTTQLPPISHASGAYPPPVVHHQPPPTYHSPTTTTPTSYHQVSTAHQPIATATTLAGTIPHPPITVGARSTVDAAAASNLNPPSSSATSTHKKRKSDAIEDCQALPQIDDDDPRLDLCEDSANQIRRKIRNFIEGGYMKVGEFQTAIGCSPASYQRFMKQVGPHVGYGSDVFHAANRFFRKRELQGLKAAPGKKVRRGVESKDLDVSGITLEGESEQAVKVYDTCDDVRRKINAFLRKPDVTQAAFCREIAKSFPGDRKVQSKQLNDFLGKKGATAGNTSCVYYGSYVFFEKHRLKEGKPKTQMREEMEKIHPGGMNTTEVMNYVTCFGNERPYTDKYGRLGFAHGPGGPSR
ncbi:hypothetical protein VD0002_g3351 [Verticillium dahliae]|uniref:DUF7726 domain-containing protein n=2 Tax=Verticillium dahliae TaxID=27337 RepID=G2XBA7_VERDV|nr:uncharacterized protein VDAG_07245 [Verticillium dahliae VdLs.17]KAF3349300.1 hypothetical protein VdG2_02557 [Verticillium dahliae VDG2]KAH6687041.1 hypothetical protein EV126DRAFT_433180 [Verticillium dahliae]EGY16081.1 hypothetical protein VDAG_07245 [Verticillium dahliae VdLs.17]PNH30248.1 hypothetical protein BJF96_g6524 [Verticillium dahliae]PNH47155.1 hypothetical protein VD0004_g1143 [Verticillium dahliae]